MQSTWAPVPAGLGVIPAMGAARASPWEWSCVERPWMCGKWQGQECPRVPVLSVPTCQTSPGWSSCPGAGTDGPRVCPAVPASGRDWLSLWGQPKDMAVFWASSPQQVLLPVAAELWRCLGGCEEEEERVGGKEKLLAGAHLPPAGTRSLGSHLPVGWAWIPRTSSTCVCKLQ